MGFTALGALKGKFGLAIAVGGVLAWVIGGSLVYYFVENCSTIPRFRGDKIVDFYQCPWTYAQSFYFSVQTGLSIGFGLLSESKTGSKLYSCFHILMGSSFIGGALAWFANTALSRSGNFQTRRERQLLRHMRELHLGGSGDPYEGLDLQDLKRLMVAHPHYAEVLIHKIVSDKKAAKEEITAYTKADSRQREVLARDIIVRASDELPALKGRSVSIHHLEEFEGETSSVPVKIWRWVRHNSKFVMAGTVFTVWISIGTIFSVLADDHDFVTGLYYAISTCSTAGMVATTTVDSQLHVWFTAFFALFGVPIFGVFLGMFANLLVEQYEEARQTERMQARFTEAEVAYIEHIGGRDGAETIDFPEFVEIQLLRMGLVDRETIRALRHQFQKLDRDRSGAISISDITHPASWDMVKKPTEQSRPDAMSLEEAAVTLEQLGVEV